MCRGEEERQHWKSSLLQAQEGKALTHGLVHAAQPCALDSCRARAACKFAELTAYNPKGERMWQIVVLTFGCDLVLASAYNNFRKSVDSTGRRQYQVQNGPCSYTFLLPETDSCRSSSSPYMSNAVQRDAPLDYDDSVQRLQVLENILENNTQWLMKVGRWAGSAEQELTALVLSGTSATEIDGLQASLSKGMVSFVLSWRKVGMD